MKTAVNQNQYGAFGIIRESDRYLKQQEFELWLRDIKKVTDFNGTKWEVRVPSRHLTLLQFELCSPRMAAIGAASACPRLPTTLPFPFY